MTMEFTPQMTKEFILILISQSTNSFSQMAWVCWAFAAMDFPPWVFILILCVFICLYLSMFGLLYNMSGMFCILFCCVPLWFAWLLCWIKFLNNRTQTACAKTKKQKIQCYKQPQIIFSQVFALIIMKHWNEFYQCLRLAYSYSYCTRWDHLNRPLFVHVPIWPSLWAFGERLLFWRHILTEVR